MSKYTSYDNVDPLVTDVIGLSRAPFTINTFFSTTIAQLKAEIEAIEPNQQIVFGTGTGVSSTDELKWDGSSLLIDGGITVETMTVAGIVHNTASGVFSTSLIVNADVSDSAAIVDTKLATISTSGKVANSATTATSLNSPTTIVLRDINGNVAVSASSLTVPSFSTAGVVHNNASGVFTSSLIVNADVSDTAGIVDTKLATIATSGKVSNSATTATASSTPSSIVLRDASQNFSAGTITASLSGNATTATSATFATTAGSATTATTATNFSGSLSGDVTGTQGATVIGADTVTNTKLANMAAHTFKANDTASSADPKDLTIAEVKAELGIVGSLTIGDTQIGFGNSSSNITGSSNLTWNNSTKVLSALGAELNLGSSTSVRQLVVYAASTNAHEYYGMSVVSNEFRYHTDQFVSDHVFLSGQTSTTSLECARIKGNGVLQVGVGTPGSKTILQVFSTTKGSVAHPKMTTTQRNAITSPDEGSGVYDLTTHQFMGYNGSSWVVLG